MLTRAELDARDRTRRERWAELAKLLVGEPVDLIERGERTRYTVIRELRRGDSALGPGGEVVQAGSWESGKVVVMIGEDGRYGLGRYCRDLGVDEATPTEFEPVWSDAERREVARRRRLEDLVAPGSRWLSELSGRTLVVLETRDERVRWGYADDLEDNGWDELPQFADLFKFVRFGLVPDPLPGQDG